MPRSWYTFDNALAKLGGKIFHMSVALQGKAIEEKDVHIDSTAQEKDITCPTDARLSIKIINRLNKLARAQELQQRWANVKEVR